MLEYYTWQVMSSPIISHRLGLWLVITAINHFSIDFLFMPGGETGNAPESTFSDINAKKSLHTAKNI